MPRALSVTGSRGSRAAVQGPPDPEPQDDLSQSGEADWLDQPIPCDGALREMDRDRLRKLAQAHEIPSQTFDLVIAKLASVCETGCVACTACREAPCAENRSKCELLNPGFSHSTCHRCHTLTYCLPISKCRCKECIRKTLESTRQEWAADLKETWVCLP
jgi:hypothetical protein